MDIFSQSIDPDGWQKERTPVNDFLFAAGESGTAGRRW